MTSGNSLEGVHAPKKRQCRFRTNVDELEILRKTVEQNFANSPFPIHSTRISYWVYCNVDKSPLESVCHERQFGVNLASNIFARVLVGRFIPRRFPAIRERWEEEVDVSSLRWRTPNFARCVSRLRIERLSKLIGSSCLSLPCHFDEWSSSYSNLAKPV